MSPGTVNVCQGLKWWGLVSFWGSIFYKNSVTFTKQYFPWWHQKNFHANAKWMDLNGREADTVISPANIQGFMAPSQTATTQLPIVGSVLWSKCIPGRDVWQCCAGHIRQLVQTTVCKHTWTLWLKLQTIPQNLYPLPVITCGHFVLLYFINSPLKCSMNYM